MPAKKACPVDAKALALLYAEMPADKLAEWFTTTYDVPVSKSLVCRWLAAACIPRRRYSPFAANRIECPYSQERLHEMYWGEELSIAEIALHAERVLGARPTQAVVQRWMSEAGIDCRSLTAAQRVRARRHPEQFAESLACAQAALRENPELLVTHPGGPAEADRKKGVAAAAAQKHAAALETRNCAFCGKPVTRIRANFKHPPERTYCNRSCANRGRLR